MRFAICNELFEGWDWARTCKFAADTGYDAVELAPFTVADDVRSFSWHDREHLAREAARAGVAIVGLHWLLVKPPGLHLCSPDMVVRRETRNYLVELARFCADIGGEVIVLGSPKQRQREPGISQAQAIVWLRETAEAVADVAEPLGVTLCLEPLPAEDTNFLNSLEEVARIVRAMDHPALRLILDVKSMGSEGIPIPDLVRTYGPLAAHFHANDTNRRGPGDGETDFLPIFAALKAIDYSGTVSVEVFDYTPDPETIARHSIEYMRRVLAEAEKH